MNESLKKFCGKYMNLQFQSFFSFFKIYHSSRTYDVFSMDEKRK